MKFLEKIANFLSSLFSTKKPKSKTAKESVKKKQPRKYRPRKKKSDE